MPCMQFEDRGKACMYVCGEREECEKQGKRKGYPGKIDTFPHCRLKRFCNIRVDLKVKVVLHLIGSWKDPSK